MINWKKVACLLLAGTLACQTVAVDRYVQINAEEAVNADAATEVLEIATVEAFKAFANRVNAGETFEGKMLRLSNDIVFDGVSVNNFEPITGTFSGIFDGAGHSISGIIMVEENGYLFEKLTSATIKNLVIKNCEYDTSNYAAGLANLATDSKIQNCQIGENVRLQGKYASSGFVITAENSIISNCSVLETAYIKSSGYAMGIAKNIENTSVVSCKNVAMVTGGSIAAGIVGTAETSTIIDCRNENLVEATLSRTVEDEDAGFAAGIVSEATNSTINSCYNQGMITAVAFTGGIVAKAGQTNVYNSVNVGNIIGKQAASLNGEEKYIIYDTLENNFKVGGIVASLTGGYLNNCSSQSNIEGYNSRRYSDRGSSYYTEYNYIGGLVGIVDGASYIQNSFQSGDVIIKIWDSEDKVNVKSELIACINSGKTVINNTYFLPSQSNTENDGDGIYSGASSATTRNLLTKTTTEMQSSEFLTLLNSNRGSNNDWLPWIATADYPTIKKCGVVMVNNTILGMYEEGTTVTFKAVPSAEGYQISTPIINDGAVSYQDNGDGTYSFTMPAGLVQVDYEETKIIITPTPEITPAPTEEVTVAPEVSQTPTDDGSYTPTKTNTPVPTTNVTPTPSSGTKTAAPTPTKEPTKAPTAVPTKAPTLAPTNTPAPEPVITTKNNKLVLYVGGNTQSSKKYNVKVSNLSDYSISYKSSAPAVASVTADGKIVAKKTGTAAIFADIKDKTSGKVTSFVLANVTVKKASLTFAKKVSSLKVKKTATFKVKKNGIAGTVKWSVSNKKLASISSKGVLKGKKPGKVKVTATCGKKKVAATVKIKK